MSLLLYIIALNITYVSPPKTKSIANSVDDFPIDIAPSFFPKTTFNPLLNRMGGRSSVFILNADDLISTSTRTPSLVH